MTRILKTLTLLGLLLAALADVACSKSKPDAAADKTAAVTSAAATKPVASAGPKLKSCAECEAATACTELMAGCSKFTGDDAKQCEAVKECVQRTGCAQGKEHTFTGCYCGELGTAKCLEMPLEGATAPKGACKAPIAKAYGTVKTNTDVLTRFIEPEYPGGAALARLNCLKFNCERECSFDKEGPVLPGLGAPK
jgi:3-oxoacyl-ACP reductase-like protein